MGYRNARVAQDSYHRFRAKMRGDVNYGNARGRAREKLKRKLEDLEGEEEEEEMEEDVVEGEEGGDGDGAGFPSVLAGERAFGSVLDAQREDGEGAGESSGTASKGKKKQVQVKKEVGIKQETWEWSGDDVSYMEFPV
jgi:hypothetical protein